MIKNALIAVTLFLSMSCLYGQQLQFDILLMNRKIGSAMISKTEEEDGKERYRLFSQAAARVLMVQQTTEVTFDVLFKGGQLLSSLYKIIKDDEQIHTTVQKNANQYMVKSTLGNRSFSGHVGVSSIQLYFKEPTGIQQVFVERLGTFLPLTKLSPGVYEYVLPDGIRNIYRYRNGRLYEVEVKKGVGSVIMRPATH